MRTASLWAGLLGIEGTTVKAVGFDPEGAATCAVNPRPSPRHRGSAVLVEEAAEAITAFDVGCGTTGERDRTDRVIWRSLTEALVRPDPVVVTDELGQHAFQVLLPKDQQVVEHLSTHGADPALSDSIGSRRPVGQADNLDALAAEDVVEGGGELGIAVAEQEPDAQLAVLQLPGQVPSLLGHPLAGRVECAAGDVDAAAAELDEEEDVQPGQPDRVDDEEVGGQDLVGMLADELRPRAMAASGSREQVVSAEDVADGDVGAAVADPEQFTLDAAVAPAGVLAGETDDELVEFGLG